LVKTNRSTLHKICYNSLPRRPAMTGQLCSTTTRFSPYAYAFSCILL